LLKSGTLLKLLSNCTQ